MNDVSFNVSLVKDKSYVIHVFNLPTIIDTWMQLEQGTIVHNNIINISVNGIWRRTEVYRGILKARVCAWMYLPTHEEKVK